MNYEEFRKLLKDGIAGRSIQSFANEVGLSREYISRLLNNETIKRPSWDNIEKIANGMTYLDVDKLLKACDYDESYITEKSRKEEESIITGLKTFAKDSNQVYDSVEECINTIEMIYTDGTFEIREKETLNEAGNKAEEYAKVWYHWKSCGYRGKIPFVLYYSTTKGGKVVIMGYTTEVSKLESYGMIKEKMKELHPIVRNDFYHIYQKEIIEAANKKIKIGNLFKMMESSYLPIVKLGYGFYYRETTDSFLSFLMDHAGTFCKKKENTKLFQKAILPNADLEDVFSEFCFGDEGTGAVIAYIMHEETGLDFCYWKSPKEFENNSCIMIQIEEEQRIPEEILRVLYQYACELNIQEFGICFFQDLLLKTNMHWYETNNFYLEKTK